MSSYNSQANSKMSKKSMYIKKSMDSDIPENIMRLINKWIDCYNYTIREIRKINSEYNFEESINDTSFMTAKMKMSRSCQKSENELFKYEKEIFECLTFMSDEKIDLYCEKLSQHMNISKDFIIKTYVNPNRFANKQKPFDPNYKKLKQSTSIQVKDTIKKEVTEEKTDSNGKVLYGDAWDLI